MKTFNKTCEVCKCEFVSTGPAGKFCSTCGSVKRKESQLKGSYTHKLKYGLISNPGVGKGGSNTKLSEDTQYIDGISWFKKNRRRLKDERRYCEECKIDLSSTGRYHWVIHHIDHDRSNNLESNLKLLCKRCHQVEHECHLAFLGRVTTIQ